MKRIVLCFLLIAALLGCKQAPTGPTPEQLAATDMEAASDALVQYFSFLNEKNYAAALPFHGSGYEDLIYWNPEADPEDHIALLRAGCEQNGWVCAKVADIRNKKLLAPGTYQFTVQFLKDDGTQLKTESKQLDFDYTVTQSGNQWLVTPGPVYQE